MPNESEAYTRTGAAEAIRFYDQNYDVLQSYLLSPEADKIILGNSDRRFCRFCERQPPDAIFKDIAHAIPEMLGNKTLFCAFECYECNHFFGNSIENSLGNWSKPTRTLTRIRGKNKVPTLTKGSSGGWRIEAGPNGLDVKIDEGDTIVTVDQTVKELTFRLRRAPYIPVAVFKAFVKIGLTLLPEDEVVNFKHALRWIRDTDHSRLPWKFPVFYTFQPGLPLPEFLAALILRRKTHVQNLPYIFLILSYGNETFQVMIPSVEKDAGVLGRPFHIPRFPVAMEAATRMTLPPEHADINLCGCQTIKDDVLEFVMSAADIVYSSTPDGTLSEAGHSV